MAETPPSSVKNGDMNKMRDRFNRAQLDNLRLQEELAQARQIIQRQSHDYESLRDFNDGIVELLAATLTLAWGDMQSGEWLPAGRKKTMKALLDGSTETTDSRLEALINRCKRLQISDPTTYRIGAPTSAEVAELFQKAKKYTKETFQKMEFLRDQNQRLLGLNQAHRQDLLRLQYEAPQLRAGYESWQSVGKKAVAKNKELIDKVTKLEAIDHRKRNEELLERIKTLESGNSQMVDLLGKFDVAVQRYKDSLIEQVRGLIGGQPTTDIELCSTVRSGRQKRGQDKFDTHLDPATALDVNRRDRMHALATFLRNHGQRGVDIKSTLGLNAKADLSSAVNHSINTSLSFIEGLCHTSCTTAYRLHRYLTRSSLGHAPHQTPVPNHGLDILVTLIMEASMAMGSATAKEEHLKSLTARDMLDTFAQGALSKEARALIDEAIEWTREDRQDPESVGYPEDYTEWQREISSLSRLVVGEARKRAADPK